MLLKMPQTLSTNIWLLCQLTLKNLWFNCFEKNSNTCILNLSSKNLWVLMFFVRIWDLDSIFQHYGASANNVCTGNVTGQKSRAKVGHPFVKTWRGKERRAPKVGSGCQESWQPWRWQQHLFRLLLIFIR